MKSSPFFRFRLLGIFFSILAALIILQMVRIQSSAQRKEIGEVGQQYQYEAP